MRRKKRGTEESFSFLIGLLIFIMIVTPFLILGYRAWAAKQGVEKCFVEIGKIGDELKLGEMKALPCKFNPEYVLIGFDANQQEMWSDIPVVVMEKFTLSNIGKSLIGVKWLVRSEPLRFMRPKDCESDKACLCLCSKFNPHIGLIKPKASVECQTMKCKNFKKETKITHLAGITAFFDYFRNTAHLFVYGTKGIHGLELKKLNNLLLICSSSAEDCEITIDYFSLDIDEIKQAMITCKNSPKGKCDFKVVAPEKLEFMLQSYGGDYQLGYYEKGAEGSIKIVGSVGELGKVCLYDMTKNKKTVLDTVGVRYKLDNLQLYNADGEVCFLAKEVAEAKKAAVKPDYTDEGKHILTYIEACSKKTNQKCVCDFKLDLSKFTSSDVKEDQITKIYFDLWHKKSSTGDKYHRYFASEVHNKVGGEYGLLMAEDAGENACIYDGVNVIKPEQDKKYRTEGLSLIKIKNDVCFADATIPDKLKLPKCDTTSSTVSLR